MKKPASPLTRLSRKIVCRLWPERWRADSQFLEALYVVLLAVCLAFLSGAA